jgi:aromatic ring-opening dioxygenase catalytic subunit (LigB family)
MGDSHRHDAVLMTLNGHGEAFLAFNGGGIPEGKLMLGKMDLCDTDPEDDYYCGVWGLRVMGRDSKTSERKDLSLFLSNSPASLFPNRIQKGRPFQTVPIPYQRRNRAGNEARLKRVSILLSRRFLAHALHLRLRHFATSWSCGNRIIMSLENSQSPLLPTYFLSHGGGPWAYMQDQMRAAHANLEASLRAMPEDVGCTPKAILAVSGHWEESGFTVMANTHPPMVYDYSGFPEHTYRVRYSAPGSPEVASRVQQLLQQAGIESRPDDTRGFDHGVFVPMFVAYSAANVPILQLSIRADYDPAAHLEAGRALAPLRAEGVLIVASGLSYHNMRGFNAAGAEASRQFDAWLTRTLCEESPQDRAADLAKWQDAPAARQAHPREDHLIPLMVAVGAAENEKGHSVYHEDSFLGGVTVSSFRFGGHAE